MEPIKTNDWKTWLTIAVVVLTALLQAVNGGKIDSVEKKVEKTIEKSERVEKDVADVKAQFARPVPVAADKK
jgi:hypothetical protein